MLSATALPSQRPMLCVCRSLMLLRGLDGNLHETTMMTP